MISEMNFETERASSSISEIFNYQSNKRKIAEISSGLGVSPINAELNKEAESDDIGELFFPLNERYCFQQDGITREMYLKYQVNLSNHLPTYHLGQVMVIDELAEFEGLTESIKIENAKHHFLADKFEYRPEVIIIIKTGLFHEFFGVSMGWDFFTNSCREALYKEVFPLLTFLSWGLFNRE